MGVSKQRCDVARERACTCQPGESPDLHAHSPPALQSPHTATVHVECAMLSARKSTKAGARKGASSRSASPALDAAAATRSVEQQPASDARDEQQQQQQQQQEQQDNGASRQYLILTVHEARNLVACDYSTHSSDAYARVSLAGVSRKTRPIHRNCHPLWAQQLVVPIEGVSAGEPLLVQLFDRNFNGKVFLGQVLMTLGKALEISGDEAAREQYWFALGKQRSTDIVSGSLCLGFCVASLDSEQHAQVLGELHARLDPEAVAAAYGAKALHVQLRGLNGLAASGLFDLTSSGGAASSSGKDGRRQQGLCLCVKYGKVLLEKPLPALPQPQLASDPAGGDSSSLAPTGCELAVDEKVVIPLAPAVKASPLVARKRHELLDIKLYLKSGNVVIAKTQIPIAAVPVATSDEAAADPASGGCDSRPEAPPSGDTRQGGSASLRAACKADAEATRAASGSSVPSTPRGTAADFRIPAYGSKPAGGAAPTDVDTGGVPASTRSDSDAAAAMAAVQARLAGLPALVTVSSNLSTCSGSSSLGGATAGRLVVEGSLGSITASSRPGVQSPASLAGRRVQGLAALHDAGATRMRPLMKAVFMPPREACRTAWTPIRRSACDSGDAAPPAASAAKSFTRTLEAAVPLHCHLELVLGLAITPHQAQLEAAWAEGAAAGAGSLGGVATSDDSGAGDDAEAAYDDGGDAGAAAPPLQLPQPFEVLLQDVLLPGISVNRLHSLLLASDSALMRAHYAAQELTEVASGPWRAPPAGSECLRVRSVSYTKRLHIPVPLAPERCRVWEEHRLLERSSAGWVAQVECHNDAPKGDCFAAHVQLCGVRVSSDSSRLRISMQLVWRNNTWGKGMVQAGAEADAKKGWAACVALLKQHAGPVGPCSSERDAAATTALPVIGAAGPGPLVAHAAPRSSARLAGVPVRSGGSALQLALVAAILLWAVAVWRGAQSVSHELRQMTAAVRRCQGAL